MGTCCVPTRCDQWIVGCSHIAGDYLSRGIFDQMQHDRFVKRLSDAVADGVVIATSAPRIPKFGAITLTDTDSMLLFNGGVAAVS